MGHSREREGRGKPKLQFFERVHGNLHIRQLRVLVSVRLRLNVLEHILDEGESDGLTSCERESHQSPESIKRGKVVCEAAS